MKKFFTLLLLSISFFLTAEAQAEVRSASEQPTPIEYNSPKNKQDLANLYKEIPDLNDKEAVRKYLTKRLSVAQRANMTLEEIASPRSISLVDVNALKEKQKETLSAYEKLYQDSMNRASTNAPLNADTQIEGDFYEFAPTNTLRQGQTVPDFPYVTIKLSDTKEIIAPAEEHIAYFLTTLDIEATGLINVTEEIIFVSNNESFPQGFFRILPKYSYSSRSNQKRRYDITLKSVTINDQEYPYKVTEIGNYLYIEPEEALNLPTGIYTYKFNYLVDRAVWYYKNFVELYWDITGKTIINVIGSANAIITLPTGKEFMAQYAIASTSAGLDSKRVTITSLSQNALGFADTKALAVGDDVHINITLDKDTLVTPSFTKKYFWFIQDYGAILFALLALLAIIGAYHISLKQIRQNKDKTKASLKRTPALFRLINSNVYDVRSLISEIADLMSKSIITLTENNAIPVFIKKTDNLKKLPKAAQKLMKILFPGAETSLPATELSKLKLKRAYSYLKKQVYSELTFYKLKLNSLYILSSTLMLLFGIIATAIISVNPWHTFWIISICSILMTPFIFVMGIKFRRKIFNLLTKLFVAIIILFIAGWMTIYTSRLYAVLIIISIAYIISYSRAFSRRSGLLRNKIKETEEYKSYLQKNPELTVGARDFQTKIPYIYAFELENKYKTASIFSVLSIFEDVLKSTK